MIRLIVALVVLAAVTAGAQQPNCPSGTKYTWLGGSANWHQANNWSPAAVPGDDDIAYIGSVDSTNNEYPEVSTGSVTICSLELEETETGNPPTLTIKEPQSGQLGFTIAGRNGLTLGANCDLIIEKRGALALSTAGTVTLDGHIVFGGQDTDDRAFILLPPGATMLKGGGYILGRVGNNSNPVAPDVGHILGPPDSKAAVLVVGQNNAIYGDMVIDVALVNNGVIDPNGQVSPTYGKRMYLNCAAKIGCGDWKVTGGASGSDANKNKLIINVDMAGTGDILIDPYGVLQVNRHFTTTGTFTLKENGEYHVAQDIYFETSRLVLNCLYAGS